MASQELHSGKLTLENMQALIEQSRVIPVEMTQVKALEEMKVTVNAWLERASDASPPTSTAPIAEINESAPDPGPPIK